MKSRLKVLHVCVVCLLAMILLPMGALAAGQPSGALNLPSLDSQAAPSDSTAPSPSAIVQPSAEEQPAVTPTPEATPSPSASVEPSPTAQPSLTADGSTVTTQADESSDFTTTDVEGGVEITKYTGNATDLVIPANINGKKVVSVGRYIVQNTALKSVTFSEGIVEIKEDALIGCKNLKNITLSSTITTIGDSAFNTGEDWISSVSSLRKVTIPATVTSIGYKAFGFGNWIYGTDGSVAETYAKNSMCAFISSTTQKDGDYYFKANNEYLDDKGQVIDGIIIVGYEGTGSSLSIGNLGGKTVVGIGPAAFRDNTTLTSLTIGDTVRGVGAYAFRGCTALTTAVIGKGTNRIGNEAFRDCTALESIQLNEGLYDIDEAAFDGCSHLKICVFPTSLTYIGMAAFHNCESLQNPNFSNNIKTINDWAFSGCKSIQSIVIPGSVNYLGRWVFEFCTALEKVTVSSGVTELRDGVFEYDKNLKHVDIPETVTAINDAALGKGSSYFSSRCDAAVIYGNTGSQAETFAKANGFVFVGNSTKQSGDFYYEEVTGGVKIIAYKGNADKLSLNQIDGKDIVAIGDSVFTNQSQLTSVTFGNKIESIGIRTFKGSGITAIAMDKSLKTIGESAFEGCGSLSSVTLNNGLTTIGPKAFYHSRVTGIIIPDSVTEMGDDSFSNCSYLKTVGIGAGLQTIGGFADCTALKTVTFSSNSAVTAIMDNGFNQCSALTSIVLPSGLKSIGDDAFACCYALEEITIPDGVISIGGYAFSSCPALKKAIIPASVTTFAEKWGKIAPFGNDEKVTIYGKSGSAAETMAANSQLPFVSEKTLFFDGYYYDNVAGGVKIIKADSPLKTTLPLTLGGKPIVEIGYRGFSYNLSLESLNCTTLKVIGEHAFYMCGNLKNVILGSSLTSLAKEAFEYCTALKTLQINPGLTGIPDSAFFGCGALTKAVIPESLTSIGSYAFGFSPVQLVIYGVKGSTAQTYAAANKIRFVEAGTANENGYYYENVTGGVKIVATDNPGKANVPATLGGKPVVEIGDYAFFGDTDLTGVDSSNLKVIGKESFSGCTNLTEVKLGSGATSIGDAAFYECTALKKVKVPASVTNLGEGALGGYKSDSSSAYYHYWNTNQNYFYIYGVKGSAAATYASKYNMRFITDTTPKSKGYYYENVKDGVEIIACDNPEGTGVPDTLDGKKVVAIGDLAFANEQIITSANMSSNIQSIGKNAFLNCKNLKNSTVSNNTATLGAGAYSYCTGLTKVSLGTGIDTVQSMTFAQCTALTSITLPVSIKSIESKAFYLCDNLKTFIIPNGAANVKIGAYAVRSANLEKAYLPTGVRDIGETAFYTISNSGFNKNPDNLIIYGVSGTMAESYALKNGIPFSTEVYTLGDVNNDGNINASDALQDLRHSVNEIQLAGTEFSAGDVTKDGKINASDALQILRYSVSEITSF